MSFKRSQFLRSTAALGVALGFALTLGCEADLIDPEVELAAIEVTPQPAVLELDESLQLEAVLLDASSNRINGPPVFWASEDTTVARVSASGLVTGRARGTTRIGASSLGVSGTATVTVEAKSVASVSVSPSQVEMTVGETRTFTATALSRSSEPLSGRATLWSSEDSAIVRVDANGTATALRVGSTRVTASVDGKTATSSVSVRRRPVARVDLGASGSELIVGEQRQLTATPRAADGSALEAGEVFWSSSNPAVIQVSTTGVLTALAPGASTVTALVDGVSAARDFSVSVVPIASLSVSPASAQLNVGQTRQLTATPRAANGSTLAERTVDWSTSASTVAQVSASGLVTAVGPGQATITASAEGKTASSTITVDAIPVATVEVSPTSAELIVGATRQLNATLKSANGQVLTGRPVSWSTSSSNVARVSDTGLVTAVSPGEAKITASSEGKTATSTITVARERVGSVEVSPSSVQLTAGSTEQLSAIVKSEDGQTLSGRNVNWSSSARGVAEVSNNGLVTAVAPGQATITAMSEGRSGTATVVVVPVPVASVEVIPSSVSLDVGGTRQLTATLKSAEDETLSGRTVSWTSNAPLVAQVSSSGLVTALTPGEAVITASSEGKSGTASVTVSAVSVASVETAPTQVDLQVGQTRQIVAVARGADGSSLPGRAVNWSSSAAGVAEVSPSGMVTAVSPGDATITATSEGRTGSTAVKVTPIPVATVTVSPNSADLWVGGTRQLTATLLSAAGATLSDRTIGWTSSAPGVVRVSESGLATALAPGQATITASSEGRSGISRIAVLSSAQPARIVIVSGNNQIGANNRALPDPLVVRVLDAGSNPLAGIRVSWETSNGRITEESLTDSRGEAEATWTLGPGGPGDRAAWAEVSGLARVQFTARRE